MPSLRRERRGIQRIGFLDSNINSASFLTQLTTEISSSLVLYLTSLEYACCVAATSCQSDCLQGIIHHRNKPKGALQSWSNMALAQESLRIGPILRSSLRCQFAYQLLVAAAKAHESALPEDLKIHHFEHEHDMFEGCVANRHIDSVLGVHSSHDAEPPVDYVLRNSTCLRELVLELLGKLESELRQGTRIHAPAVPAQC